MSTTNSANMSLDAFTISSKKISNYAIAISVAAHLIMLGAVKYGYLFSSTAPVAANEETYIDLGYQTLNEVPTPPPVAAKSEEMQDEKSEVQSLQKEKSKPLTDSAPSAPTYADVPYYKIKPKYPKDALEAGVEGNVRFSIDILEDGTVDNIKTIGGEKLNMFETVAMRAVSKYKYKPFTDTAGNPIKKIGHVVLVDFKLKDEIATQ